MMMLTEGGHKVECDEDDGTLVRVNGICVAHFAHFFPVEVNSKRKNQVAAAQLAMKIFAAIQRREESTE